MARVPCTHCHLEFDESVMITEEEKGKKLHFCCRGCQGVYHLLKEEGLESFYDKLGNQTLEPAETALKKGEELARFDLEGFHKKYVRTTPEGFNEIHLIIEGIHCSACVWLNEKVLHQTPGIIEATINYSNNKAKVVWDPEQIKLSQIIETIRNIGYNAYPYDPALQEERAVKTRNDYYSRILVGVFATMNIMWIAIAQYAGYFTGMEQGHKNILNIAEFILATPTLFYSGWIFFRGAWYGLKNRLINMDVLVATGATLAYLYSIYAMITHKGEVYFDSVTMIITFVLVGKYLEVLSKKQAADTLDRIIGSMPTEAMVVKADGSKALVSVENIEIGDLIELKPGEKVAVDGILRSGKALFDESSLTGESEPVFKEPGDEILSGTICLDSVVRYEATKRAGDSLLSQITELLSDAVTKKPRIEQLANVVSGYFSVAILSIALLTFAGWYWHSGSFETALIVAISVIVIACPCALGLATPMATLVGIGRAAKEGILFKEAAQLETMAKSDLLALDKTGTITEGRPSVLSIKTYESFDPAELLALVHSSNHPVSRGIERYLLEHYENLAEIKLSELKSIEAKGVTALCDGKKLAGGNRELMQSLGIACDFESEHTLFVYAVDGKIAAEFELRDRIRPGIREVITHLKAMGIWVVMLTGDHEASAKKVAEEVGIEEVHARLLPQEKAEKIQGYHEEGHIVVMAGDGINDAVALASSDIAIAMGSGADVAIEVSDVVLLEDKPESLLAAYRIGRQTFRTVKQNLGFSLLYNLVAVPLAVLGFVNPLVAALSMSLSSLFVVGNSTRIKLKK
ncbi:heavy metal translocating P-type ATPase [Nitratifractor salsuginis]|uniref:Heavy metal translocating P-type ATPase n=1 Tax=Nitratifractor salsuginis (strain DSM 16511 / JCM 12458 / E9I37-1) TaxID=749222 RepID=E6X0Z4_NITSE|nr:heavy metal translocating P-type ATPase [Nitratifractor salsuginis]ADV46926.1 heavy metal translocating P-type ATPase [Nitratifractor salsuginis DSM 16511]